jgi:glucosamine--fructose-6-phosphate aminotransferase (isomerizing)
MGSLMVEYCLALYMAYVSGKMTEKQVQDKLAEISSLADAMDKTIKENMDTIEELGKKMKLDDTSTFLGGGPNYGTAFFSMAKVIEATRTNAVGQELEEWAHEQYFTTNEKTTTFVLTPPGAGVTRAREQMYAIRQMGSTCVAICDPDDAETIKEADVAIRVFGKFEEVLSPLLYCVPAELFAFHFAVAHNVTMLGFDNPKIKEVNWRQIFGSHVER